MPKIGPAQRPPWLPERKAHEGRTEDLSKMYQSSKWRKLRAQKLAANPLCECSDCQAGIPLQATMVDHRRRYRDGGDFWDWANLQSMSSRCHNRKSGKEAHGK